MTMTIIILIKLSYVGKIEMCDPFYINLVYDTLSSISLNKEPMYNNVELLPTFNKDKIFYSLPYTSMDSVQNFTKPPFLGQPYSNTFYFRPVTIKILSISFVFLSLLVSLFIYKIIIMLKFYIYCRIITRAPEYNKHSTPYWQGIKKSVNELGPKFGIPPVLTSGNGSNNGDDGDDNNYNNNKGKGKVPFLFYNELMDIYNILFTLLNDVLVQLSLNNPAGVPASYFMDWHDRMTRASELSLKYRHIEIVLRINVILDDLSDIHLNMDRDSSRQRRIQVSQELLLRIARKVVLLMLDIQPNIYDLPFEKK